MSEDASICVICFFRFLLFIYFILEYRVAGSTKTNEIRPIKAKHGNLEIVRFLTVAKLNENNGGELRKRH